MQSLSKAVLQATSSELKLHKGTYYVDSSSFVIGDSSNIFSFDQFDDNETFLLSISLSSDAIQSGVTFQLENTFGLTKATGFDLEGQLTSLGAFGSLASVQSALDALKVDTAGENSQFNLDINISEKSDTIFFNPGTISRNYYEFVQGNISWNDAEKGAKAKVLYEQPGHLATIRSEEENDFIANKTSAKNIWIGATDREDEGKWKWSGGPDNGILFWHGQGSADDLSVDGEFESWNRTVEPNNATPDGEHYAVTNYNDDKGEWNDLRAENDNIQGYIVEYEQPQAGWPGDQQIKLKRQTPSSFLVSGFIRVNLFGDQSGSGTIEATDPEGLSKTNGIVSIEENPSYGDLSFDSQSGEWSYVYRDNNSTDLPDSDSFVVSIEDDAGFKTTESIVIAFSRDVDDRFEDDSTIKVIEKSSWTGPLDYSEREDSTNLEIYDVFDIESTEDETGYINFGPGVDQLKNTCVLNVSDGFIDMGADDDILTTNMYISTNELRGGDGFDQLILTNETCDDVTGAKEALPMLIDSFEDIEIQGGIWQLEGDHRKADVLISGGTMQVPLTKRSQVGLQADRLKYVDGEISVSLDLNDVSSPTKGRWNVIKGLSRGSKQLLQNDLDQLNLDLIGSGPDDPSLEPNWIFRGDKLLLSITDGL